MARAHPQKFGFRRLLHIVKSVRADGLARFAVVVGGASRGRQRARHVVRFGQIQHRLRGAEYIQIDFDPEFPAAFLAFEMHGRSFGQYAGIVRYVFVCLSDGLQLLANDLVRVVTGQRSQP